MFDHTRPVEFRRIGDNEVSIDNTILERLSALEASVAQIQRELLFLKTPPDWLDCVRGSVTDQEAFRAALDYGRAHRQADRRATRIKQCREVPL